VLRALAIDFNSYFASVEQQERPELRGKPVAVVPVMAETTGAIAVSIEAKAMGMKRNRRIAEARREIPGLIVVEARPETYINYHRRIKDVVETCVPVKKIQSIDELECELTGSLRQPEKALALARRIKAVLAREIGPHLRSSIGIGPNWFLAKLASDIEKPDGLTLLSDHDILGQLISRNIQLSQLTGIGENMEKRLRATGIESVEQLYAASRPQLRAIWNSVEGARFHDWLHGGAQEREPPRHNSIGHGHVLPPQLRTPEAALGVLHRLLQKAAMRLRHENFYAGALHLTVRYQDGARGSQDCHFNETQDTFHFTRVLNDLWSAQSRENRNRIPKQVGIVLHKLLPASHHIPDLFAADQEKTRTRLFSAIDTLNQTFGKNSVYFGGAHGSTDYAPMRIAFTRIPEPEIEEINRSRQRRLNPERS